MIKHTLVAASGLVAILALLTPGSAPRTAQAADGAASYGLVIGGMT